MFNTIALTVNGVAKTLNRVNDSEPYSSVFFLEDGDTEYTMSIKHTIPKNRGLGTESHLVRLDVTKYDADSAVEYTTSTWQVLSTSIGRQPTVDLTYYSDALNDWMTTNRSDILARQN